MLQGLLNKYIVYILIGFIFITLGLIVILFKSNKKIKELDKRVDTLETFEIVLANLTKSSDLKTISEYEDQVENFEQSNETFERPETKKYKGDTKLDRLVSEFLDIKNKKD